MKIYKIFKNIMIFGFFCTISFCSSFITVEKQEDIINRYESMVYVLTQDVVLNDQVVLKKNQRVRIIVEVTRGAFEDENLKVYAYPDDDSRGDPLLKKSRFLILYMFADDFDVPEGQKKPVFNEELFRSRLLEVASIVE